MLSINVNTPKSCEEAQHVVAEHEVALSQEGVLFYRKLRKKIYLQPVERLKCKTKPG